MEKMGSWRPGTQDFLQKKVKVVIDSQLKVTP